MSAEIHLVSKHDFAKHVSISTENLHTPLPTQSVRVRSKILSMSLNNMTYASLGDRLHWWNAYPVPAHIPAPFCNNQDWGIVPAWGFGEVIETTTDIPAGALLYGFWPTSSHLVDLTLVQDEPKGHYREISEHRQSLMSTYNRYEVMQASLSLENLAWKASLEPVWGCGYVMSRFCFADSQQQAIHPNGGAEWTATDADLTSAVVINLAASSQTARSFTWNLTRRPKGSGPLAIVQVTTCPESIFHLSVGKIYTRAVEYDAATSAETIQWIASCELSRIVIADFGAPKDTVQRLHDAILASNMAVSKLIVVYVGSSPQQLALDPRAQTVMVNTSPVMEAAITIEGPATFFQRKSEEFWRSIDEKIVEDVKLEFGHGVQGEGGIEGAWERLSGGNWPRQTAFVFNIRS